MNELNESAPEQAASDLYRAEPRITESQFQCLSCGYDLRGLAVGDNCPECGKQIALIYESVIPASGFAPWSLVCGILAFPSCFIFGVGTFVLGPLAVLFWWLTRRQIKAQRRTKASMGIANAGLICAIVAMSIVGVFWIVVWWP